MAVKATIFYNNVFFTLINKNEADKGIFAGTILSRITEDENKDIYIGNSFQYICEDDDNLVVTINYEGNGEVVVMFNLNVLSDDLVF